MKDTLITLIKYAGVGIVVLGVTVNADIFRPVVLIALLMIISNQSKFSEELDKRS